MYYGYGGTQLMGYVAGHLSLYGNGLGPLLTFHSQHRAPKTVAHKKQDNKRHGIGKHCNPHKKIVA